MYTRPNEALRRYGPKTIRAALPPILFLCALADKSSFLQKVNHTMSSTNAKGDTADRCVSLDKSDALKNEPGRFSAWLNQIIALFIASGNAEDLIGINTSHRWIGRSSCILCGSRGLATYPELSSCSRLTVLGMSSLPPPHRVSST